MIDKPIKPICKTETDHEKKIDKTKEICKDLERYLAFDSAKKFN